MYIFMGIQLKGTTIRPVLGTEDSDRSDNPYLQGTKMQEGKIRLQGSPTSAFQVAFMCNMDGRHGAGLAMSESLKIPAWLPGFSLQPAFTAQGSCVGATV